MATLIASTAQVDHIQANEAQSKLTNLIKIDTANDVSQAVFAQSNIQKGSPNQSS